MQVKTLVLATFAALAVAGPLPDGTALVAERVQPVNPRAATCTPTAGGSSSKDDTPNIEAAIKSCASGTIVIPKGKTYYINSQLTFTGCSGCTIQLNGELLINSDYNIWNGKGAIILISSITGLTITGSGTIDGNGQKTWDYIASHSLSRPNLIRVTGSQKISMSGITVKNAPQFHIVTTGNSKNVAYSGITLHSVSSSSNIAHNTDGFDIGPASYVTVSNCKITNDDDCVVLKPGASYVTTSGVSCTGGHGFSVGSLAGGKGSTDTVTNSVFKDSTCTKCAKAAGIKIYPSTSDHGTATVSNVIWSNIICDSCDYAVQVTECYASTAAECSASPSTAKISGVVFSGFTGTTSGHYKSITSDIECSKKGTCGITMSNYKVKAANGANQITCANTPSNLGVTCTPA